MNGDFCCPLIFKVRAVWRDAGLQLSLGRLSRVDNRIVVSQSARVGFFFVDKYKFELLLI